MWLKILRLNRVDFCVIQINKLHREDIESQLTFAGFLVFHCPLKPDAIETLKMLSDSSHRVRSEGYRENLKLTETVAVHHDHRRQSTHGRACRP